MNNIEEAEPENFELNVELKDFGRISKGNISLKPLTIFIGSNNSGKSYASMLIHSIFESRDPSPNFTNRSWRNQQRYPFRLNKPSRKRLDTSQISELTKNINKLEENDEIKISDELINEAIPEIIDQWFKNRFDKELKYLFSSQLSDLNRIGNKRKSPFVVNVSSENMEVNIKNLKKGLEYSYRIKEKPEIKIKCSSTEENTPEPARNKIKLILPKEFTTDCTEDHIEYLIYRISEEYIHSQFGNSCHYLPASRSGIFQNRTPLTAGILSNMPFQDMESSSVSGIIINFLSTVGNLPNKNGDFFDLVQSFEEELIQGNIGISNSDNAYTPTIYYNFKNNEIPLTRSSSTVLELAPIFLYVKYLTRPGTLLIIEEPEAHLHPRNIRILARLFVKLIRKNVSILITTHSDYLLDQLSTFIKLSKIDPKLRKNKFNYDEEDYLKPSEVSGYLFKENKKSNGTEIVPIEINEGVISQKEFIKIRDVLYEEIIKIDDILDS